jgi:diphthine synthase
MALVIIGLGLGDERDITLRGAEEIRGADVVFLEAYTSVLGSVTPERLAEVYGKPVRVAYRETVESEAEEAILRPAREGRTVAFLVVGDPFGATTHTDLLLRAAGAGIPTRVVHNASIMNAAGACGLQLYSFGATVSIPFFTDEWRPSSWYDKVKTNAAGGMHTLALLDIKVREPNYDTLVRTGASVTTSRWAGEAALATVGPMLHPPRRGAGIVPVGRRRRVALLRMLRSIWPPDVPGLHGVALLRPQPPLVVPPSR